MTTKKSITIYWAIIGLLLLTIAGLVLKFVVLGRTGTVADGRVTILLEPSSDGEQQKADDRPINRNAFFRCHTVSCLSCQC